MTGASVGYRTGMAESDTSPSQSTLRGVLDAYAEGGFAGSFTAVEGGRLECHACNETVDASAATMSSLRRLEGASDPDDMLAVVALACPNCGEQGTVVLGYGPASAPEDGDVLSALRDDRNTSDMPGNSAPGEVAGDESATGR